MTASCCCSYPWIPFSAAAHLWNAWRLALLERRHDLALIELDAAERLDPLDLQVKTQIGYVHQFRHDVDRAIAQFEKVVALEPSFAFAHYALGDACTHRGQYDRAIEEFDKSIGLGGRSVNHIGVLGYVYGRSGNRDRANEHLQELRARSADGFVSPMWFALVYVGLSDVERVFQWLNRAFEERDGSLILITAAVEFDAVREDSRFKAVLAGMGARPFDWDQLRDKSQFTIHNAQFTIQFTIHNPQSAIRNPQGGIHCSPVDWLQVSLEEPPWSP